MTITFNLNKQTIQRTDNNKVVAGSKNYLKAKFIDCGGDWKPPITAIFGTFTQILDENNECDVPWEVLQSAGTFDVSAFCGDLHTANISVVTVEETGYKQGETPQIPTPDVYEQMLQYVDQAAKSAYPKGGTTNQVLTKLSNEEKDYDWRDPGKGSDGGYYIPEVKQPSADTFSIGYTATKDDMAEVDTFVLTLPKGEKGDNGAQGEPGKDGISPEISVIENTDTAYRLRITDATGSEDTPNLKGPQGEQGPQGEAGQQGAQGEPGPAGANGQDGAAATIQIGNVTTLEAGQDATVTNTGTANAAVFDFGIPQGAKGDTGPQGPQGEQGVQGNQGPQGPTGPAGPAGADGQDGLTTSVNGVQQQNGNITLNLGNIPATDTAKYITLINRVVLTSTAVQITIDKDSQDQDFALKSIRANIFIPENSVPDGNTGTYVRALVNGVSASDSYSNNGSAAAYLSLGQMRTAGHAAQINLDVIGANNKYILIGINPVRSFFNNGNIELTAERYTASTLNASTVWENINSLTVFSTSENYPLPVGTVVELWGY